MRAPLSTDVLIARRNLTKGQKMLALAMIPPEPEKGWRGNFVCGFYRIDDMRPTNEAQATRAKNLDLDQCVNLAGWA